MMGGYYHRVVSYATNASLANIHFCECTNILIVYTKSYFFMCNTNFHYHSFLLYITLERKPLSYLWARKSATYRRNHNHAMNNVPC